MKKEYECHDCGKKLTGEEAKGFGDFCVLCAKCYDENIESNLDKELGNIKMFEFAKDAYRYTCDRDDLSENFCIKLDEENNTITAWYDGEEHVKKIIKFDQ